MEGLHELKKMLCEELEEYSRKGELSAGSLDVIHKLTDTIKNIDKILMLEEYGEDDESRESYGGSYEGGGSYAGRRGTHYVRGHYSRDGGSYESGDSYRGGGSRDRGRYQTRDDGREHMKREMHKMMETASTDREREAIRRCMEMLDKD